MAFFGPTYAASFTDSSITASCTMALPVSGVANVVMSICWPFHANAAISVRHVIRKE